MKRLTLTIVAIAIAIGFQFATAQTANQTLNLNVASSAVIEVQGNSVDLSINGFTVGQPSASVADNTTSLSYIHNYTGAGAKISASLSSALQSGLLLTTSINGGLPVNIESGATMDVELNISAGSYTNRTIGYVFTATPEVGQVNEIQTVTYTISAQ
ncbi:MAG: hypothetical protein WC306_03350 [Candidatus Paceibacterota bacterium]|jgi:hypothetical protein